MSAVTDVAGQNVSKLLVSTRTDARTRDAESPSESLAALPSNLSALNLALSFAAGRRPFGVIHGASGWGKSHLLRIAAHEASRFGSMRVEMAAAEAWVSRRRFLDRAGVLILDDVHLITTRPKSRQLLRMELERRVRAKRPTLLAFDGMTVQRFRRLLPLGRGWEVATLRDPDDAERREVVHQICANEGLRLGGDKVRLLGRLIQGDGHSLSGAISRLRLAGKGEKFPEMHPLRFVGILHPYLVDHCDYDVRDIVLDAVTASTGKESEHAERDARRLAGLAVYSLCSIACISEESIASYFGMKQGDVYKFKRETAKKLQSGDAGLKAHLDRVLALATRNLRGV
jgi:hypothetical protein